MLNASSPLQRSVSDGACAGRDQRDAPLRAQPANQSPGDRGDGGRGCAGSCGGCKGGERSGQWRSPPLPSPPREVEFVVRASFRARSCRAASRDRSLSVDANIAPSFFLSVLVLACACLRERCSGFVRCVWWDGLDPFSSGPGLFDRMPWADADFDLNMEIQYL